MRKLLQTKASCPVVQLYLELSHIPARFAIMKSRLLFLKSILNEKEESRIYKFVKLQLDDRKKGDWIWTCLEDLKDIGFKEPIKEVKEMKTFKFRKIVTARLKEKAFNYLLNKQGIKGREIKYNEFQMAEYLLPKSIKDQRYNMKIRETKIQEIASRSTNFCNDISNGIHR